MEDDVVYIKKGLLYKRRNGMGRMMPNAWQYRFFTLTNNGTLNYYDMGHDSIGLNTSDSTPRGQLALGYSHYTLVREPSIEGAPTGFAIQIHPESGESWNLCADTEADHGQWCLELEQFLHVDYSKKGKRESLVSSYELDEDQPRKMKAASSNGTPSKQANSPSSLAAAAAAAAETAAGLASPGKISLRGGKLGVKPKGGGFLKMEKKKSKGILTVSTLETVVTMAIANYCFYLFYTYTMTEGFSSVHLLLPEIGRGLSALASMRLEEAKTIAESVEIKTPLAVLYYVAANYIVLQTLLFRTSREDKLEGEVNALKGELKELQESYYVATDAPESRRSVKSKKNSFASDDGPVVVDGKPVPGCTLEEVFTPQRLSEPHTWSRIDSSEFNVRIGPNYKWNKKKSPSPPSLYEPFAVDIFSTRARIDHATERFSLPAELTGVDTGHKGVPPVMVVQIQIPVDEPSFMNQVTDGPGWSIMMYFKITEKTLTELKDFDNASPAVKLWAQWCSEAIEVDDLRKRFKFIASCSNLIELGVPQYIADYNAKPILIRRTGSLYRGANNSYMEFDMHIHKFDTTAKKAIYSMTSKAGEMFMQIAFVIEGREDDELPEAIFGAIACNKPQEELANFIFD